MSELLDRIPGNNSALRSVRTVANQIAQFKSRQRMTAKGGQLAYPVASDDEWDYIETFPTTPANTYYPAEFLVRFTGDGSQKFPIVIPQTDVRVNGTGESNKLAMGPSGQFIYNSGGNVVQATFIDMPEPSYFESETQNAWLVVLYYTGSVTLRIKARGQSSSPGDFEIVRLV